MQKLIYLIFLLILCLPAFGQNIIKGTIVDQDKNPIAGANIFINGTYDVAISDENGNYTLKTKQSGSKILAARFLGFTEYNGNIELTGVPVVKNITLTEKPNELNSVIVQAGTFGASDSKKAVRLNSFDILTTASAVGDVYGALQTMPGTAPVGEDGGLFVRGGEGRETKTFMDGLPVHKPFTSRLDNLPSRGRFMPMMFSGTTFSTGGYSAEYGQAMSSALILNTNGIADQPLTSFILLPIGASANQVFKTQKSSLSLTGDFYNLSKYNSVVKQNIDWKKDPTSFSGSYMYRYKLSQNQLLKSYSNFSRSQAGLLKTNLDNLATRDNISHENNNLYSNTILLGKFKNDWSYKTGIAYTYDREYILFNSKEIITKENNYSLKYALSGKLRDDLRLNTGIEVGMLNYSFDYAENDMATNVFKISCNNYTPAAFTEAEYNFSKKFSIRLGGRFEYSTINKNKSLAPRLSLAYQTGKYSQVSFASGLFYQSPENLYTRFNQALKNEKALHYILNYQFRKDEFTFRAEAYYKIYSNLIKFDSLNAPNAASYNNNGNGFARGMDLFFRNNKGIDKNDWWISLSWLDTKRNYKNYPEAARPEYFPTFSFSTTYKRMIDPIHTLLGFTFIAASGRNFHNPNHPGFMNEKTAFYKDLSFSASYLTKILKQETVFHLSISNLLGFNNIYGYNYSSHPDAQGIFRNEPITSEAKRMIMFVVMISIK